MDQEINARPINHSAVSAAGATVAGAGGGAIKGGLITGAAWIAGLTAAGIGLGVLIMSGGSALAFLGTAQFIVPAIGGVVGLILGIGSSPYAAGIGAAIGGLFGGKKAAERVDNERGAATLLNAQVEAFKGQAESAALAAAKAPAANDNKYNLPEQGTPMNPASTKITTENAQLQGAVAGQELQRA